MQAENRITVDDLFSSVHIYPHFLYGIELYMFCSVSLRAKLESLFLRRCRLVAGDLNWRHQIEAKSLYRALNCLPLRLLFQHCGAVLMYKILVLKLIPILLALFDLVAPADRNARLVPHGTIVLRLPAVPVESFRHSVAYWGAKLWNSIPCNIRNCSTLSSFSQQYHDYLVSHLDSVACDRYDILDFV